MTDIKQRTIRKHLSGKEVKELLIDNAKNYTPKPHKSLTTRIEEKVIEMYKTNKINANDAIQSLGMLLGTAMKAKGKDTLRIEGKNNFITITIGEKEN